MAESDRARRFVPYADRGLRIAGEGNGRKVFNAKTATAKFREKHPDLYHRILKARGLRTFTETAAASPPETEVAPIGTEGALADGRQQATRRVFAGHDE